MGSKIVPRVDGEVLTETLLAIEEGTEKSPPMPRAAIEAVEFQVRQIMTTVMRTYENYVAVGELGPGGTCTASEEAPTSECPTGLLYGRVQSGKTLAMITAAAMAIDNGFRLVVVLTSDNTKLVEQTAARFRVLSGVIVKDSNDIGSWTADSTHVMSAMASTGLVLVTAKNSLHLSTFLQFLKDVGAAGFPALILDDEADQASLDNNTAKKARAVKKTGTAAGVASTAVHQKTNAFDYGGGDEPSLRQLLRHHVYLQVTATPFALILQASDSKLRPAFTELLEPGASYTGGDFFFSYDAVDSALPPLSYVPEDEGARLSEAGLPAGLELSLSTFLVAAAAQGLADSKYRNKAQNFLCHSSMLKDSHKTVAEKIRVFVNDVAESLAKTSTGAKHVSAGAIAIEKGIREMARSSESLPSTDEVAAYIKRRLKDREIKVVNSDADVAEFGPKLNFIIGGNILGRGLTIDNLLTTYYLRSPKTAQMDTMLQHARMFGYRGGAAPYLRVFLPLTQALRFWHICEAEKRLRDWVLEGRSKSKVPVHVAHSLRATRTTVLNPAQQTAYLPGEHLYPPAPYHGAGASQRHAAALDEIDRTLAPTWHRNRKAGTPLQNITMQQMVRALDLVPYDDMSTGAWDPVFLGKLLVKLRDLYGDTCFLLTKYATRTSLTQGMLSSRELKEMREQPGPVLCIFRDDAGKLARIGALEVSITHPYIFPELFLNLPEQQLKLPHGHIEESEGEGERAIIFNHSDLDETPAS